MSTQNKNSDVLSVLIALPIALICAVAVIYSLIYGFMRVTSGCVGSFDSYRVCNKYGFNHCAILSETEWTHISPYVTTVHRFERIGHPSQVRNYSTHTLECLDTNKK